MHFTENKIKFELRSTYVLKVVSKTIMFLRFRVTNIIPYLYVSESTEDIFLEMITLKVFCKIYDLDFLRMFFLSL